MKDKSEYKIKECFNCRWYKLFYTKGFSRFDKHDCGCCRRREATQKHDSCEQWEYNTQCNRRCGRVIRRDSALKSLSQVLNNLNEIAQILKEAYEED